MSSRWKVAAAAWMTTGLLGCAADVGASTESLVCEPSPEDQVNTQVASFVAEAESLDITITQEQEDEVRRHFVEAIEVSWEDLCGPSSPEQETPDNARLRRCVGYHADLTVFYPLIVSTTDPAQIAALCAIYEAAAQAYHAEGCQDLLQFTPWPKPSVCP